VTIYLGIKMDINMSYLTRQATELFPVLATQGAPEAQQVADCWHLLKNLREAIEDELMYKPAVLQAAAKEVSNDNAVTATNIEN